MIPGVTIDHDVYDSSLSLPFFYLIIDGSRELEPTHILLKIGVGDIDRT